MEYAIKVRDYRFWKDKSSFVLPFSIDYAWTLLAVEEGSFRYRINGKTGEAKSGDIVLCPPNIEFHREMTSPLTFHYIKCVSSDPNEQQHADIRSWAQELFAYKVTIGERDRLLSNFRNLQSVVYMDDANSRTWRNHLVNDVWIMIRREASRLSRLSGIRDELMMDAKDWIEQHVDEEITVRDIASRYHLHPVHFTRRFRQVFGTTPSRHMAACRIEKAKKLLLQTEYTIDHIAKLCGYDNGFYFSRIFTKWTNLNPSEFRSTHAPQYP